MMSQQTSRPAAAWTMESAPAAETVLNGQRYLYFAGTGYLGLQADPRLIDAAQQAVAQYGIHSATSRSGFGTSPPVREVERRAADLLGSESATYLISGYAGNFAIAAAIAPRVDLVLVDECAHDCLRESIRWLGGLRQPPVAFRHCDAGHLSELLRDHVAPGMRPLVLSDGIFAAGGEIAPLADYLDILARYDGAMLLVDDAHGLATVGSKGRGSLELASVPTGQVNRDLDEPVTTPARVFHSTTLSKAVGGQGGVIAGSRAFLDRVRAASGWFRGASAPAAPVAAATAKGLEVVQSEPERRARLAANVTQLRTAMAKLGPAVTPSCSPIIGLQLADGAQMQAVAARLWDERIAIAYVRDYSGAPAEGLLRIAVFATHTPEMIERLVDALARALAAS